MIYEIILLDHYEWGGFYKMYMLGHKSYCYEVGFKDTSANKFSNTQNISVQNDSGENGDVAVINIKTVGGFTQVSSSDWTLANNMFELNCQANHAWYEQGNAIQLQMVYLGKASILKSRSAANIAF